jgi:hypothetical protein
MQANEVLARRRAGGTLDEAEAEAVACQPHGYDLRPALTRW